MTHIQADLIAQWISRTARDAAAWRVGASSFASTAETQQIDGRFVGPVQILDDHYMQRGRIAGLAQQRGEQLIARSAGAAQFKQLTAEIVLLAPTPGQLPNARLRAKT